ncbi:MAG TPA: hypothetical protein VGN80_08165 [Devosiaceae bacterium]|jgi:hypothetical protein|nr:hypothetical protein [Devosiaceae bacterium]
MQTQETWGDEALECAVAVAIAANKLPSAARSWGKTVLLEELAPAMGMARNTLRNLYYRGDARFEEVLRAYISGSHLHLLGGIRSLAFQEFSPVVWKRSPMQLRASWRALPNALALARAAERAVRGSVDPPAELRRAAGAVAAEIMACSLTFFEGSRRRRLLQLGERLFLSTMSPLVFAHEVAPEDAMLFAKFWENRASRCGLEWSNIWDDPALPPPVDMEVVRLALDELQHAAAWTRRRGQLEDGSESERLRQLLADRAKWLAKAGQFRRAQRELERLPAKTPAAHADILLVQTLEAIAENRLQEAERSGSALHELLADGEDEASVAVATSEIMVHNIALLRGRRPSLPERAQYFLQHSPVVASELVNLPRYKERLEATGYLQPQGVGAQTAVN